MDEHPPPPRLKLYILIRTTQISAANKMTCSTAEIIIARLSLSFCWLPLTLSVSKTVRLLPALFQAETQMFR